jgi:hypothetical protein
MKKRHLATFSGPILPLADLLLSQPAQRGVSTHQRKPPNPPSSHCRDEDTKAQEDLGHPLLRGPTQGTSESPYALTARRKYLICYLPAGDPQTGKAERMRCGSLEMSEFWAPLGKAELLPAPRATSWAVRLRLLQLCLGTRAGN